MVSLSICFTSFKPPILSQPRSLGLWRLTLLRANGVKSFRAVWKSTVDRFKSALKKKWKKMKKPQTNRLPVTNSLKYATIKETLNIKYTTWGFLSAFWVTEVRLWIKRFCCQHTTIIWCILVRSTSMNGTIHQHSKISSNKTFCFLCNTLEVKIREVLRIRIQFLFYYGIQHFISLLLKNRIVQCVLSLLFIWSSGIQRINRYDLVKFL